MENLAEKLAVYVLTDEPLAGGRSQVAMVRQALEGGATAVQLRAKKMSARAQVNLGRRLRPVIADYGALYIVNDRADVAAAVSADGVHLGQEDLPASAARRLLGEGAIIGVSVTEVEEAVQARDNGADYLGLGPIFPTDTKEDAGEAVGPQCVREIVSQVDIPVVGIGGVNQENAHRVIAAGAAGVAVISAVMGQDDVRAATQRLAQAVKRGRTTARGRKK